MEQVYIETQDLSVGYHGKALLKDIALKVKKGEILVLIGPNGAGKSTILKNIIREMQPISGGIYIKGKNVKDFTSKQYAKTMSVVLTEKIKTEMMTCRDVVAMGRYPYTNYFGKLTKEDEQIVTESLEKVSAMDIAEKDFSQISDGQRQRIMLARAVCQKPEIIVLDEPTSFLDIRHKIELLDILLEMAVKDKVTVIVSLLTGCLACKEFFGFSDILLHSANILLDLSCICPVVYRILYTVSAIRYILCFPTCFQRFRLKYPY